MKKYQSTLVFLTLITLVVSCSLQKSKVIGNANVINEITHIEQLSVMDENGNNNITVKDLQKLDELTKGDEIAQDYVTELKWLVGHNESLHVLHITSFMREYINTGKDTPCIPHELWHISLYIRHGDLDYAKSQISSLSEEYPLWIKSVEQKRKAYPQFYNSLDELEQMSKESIEKLKQNDYSNETLHQLDLIGATELC